jgi:GDP-4-dehydro-6-deoxy-D-mannose reductase
VRSVLVTGAAGFAGAHLVRALVDTGCRVHGMGLGMPHADLPLDSWRTVPLADPAAVDDAVGALAPEGVVHLAGQSSAARSFEAPAETFETNVLGTWWLLEAVRRRAPRARVIVVASGEVYGPQPEGSRTTEATPFAPVSPYALSKATADALAEAHARAHGLEVIRVRAFAHTGPGQDARFVVPSWARQLAVIERGAAEPVLRVGNLEVTRDLSDVRDVVMAYVALLERGRGGAAYNVCSGTGVRLTDVVQQLLTRARVPVRVETDAARMRPADVPWLVGDPARIAGEVGWRVTIPLARVLDEVMDDWRARVADEAAATGA